MRVTVIGAGIVGVSTAWALAEAGCEVTVIERNSGVAQESSYGNAGMMAPAYVAPWAAPGMPGRILSMLWRRDAAVRFAVTTDPAFWRWAVRWLGECRVARYQVNKARMQRLAFYSRDVMAGWRAAHGFAYERTEGLLQLLRSEKDLQLARPTMAFLKEAGVAHELLSPAECRVHEPGLSDIAFAGALRLPDAEAGNCPLFARQLKTFTEEHGVRYRFGSIVEDVASSGSGVTLRIRRGEAVEELAADAVVIAAGLASAPLLKHLGVVVPLYPVKGYSASVAIREPTYAPVASVMDEAYKVAIVRLGNRIRVAGTAELGDRALSLDTKRAERAFATLLKVARDWFPGAARYHTASWWVGARPMLPDGPPVIGATGHPGIYVNLGHGSTGWTMAAGSARVVASLVSGRTPDIDIDGLTLARYD